MSDVITAVEGIPLKLAFKGAYFFALQPLATLCDPASAAGAANGLQALHSGALPRLTPALAKFVDDEQISLTILRIMEAMVQQMCATDDDRAVELFVRSGTHEGVVDWIIAHRTKESGNTKNTQSNKALRAALNIVNMLSAQKADMIPTDLTTKLAGVMLQGMDANNTTLASAHQLLDLATGALGTPESAATVAKSGGIKNVLNYLNGSQVARADQTDSIQFVHKALGVVEKVYSSTPPDAETTGSIMQLIDRFSGVPSVRERCVTLMQSAFNKDTLKDTLGTIGDPGKPFQDRVSAMKLLTPMSYIPNLVGMCGEPEIAALVSALNELQALGPKADVDAVRGCCKMLGSIARKPGTYQAVLDAGGLAACINILKNVQNPNICSGLCPLLAPLCAVGQGAERFLQSESGFQQLVDAIKPLADSNNETEVTNGAQGLSAVVQAICEIQSLCDNVADTDALEVLNKFLKSAKVNMATAEKITTAIAVMVGGMKEVEAIDHDQFFKFVDTSADNSDRVGPRSLLAVSEALGGLATRPNAKKHLDKDKMCDAAFKVIAQVAINSPTYKNASKAVEVFADEDVFETVFTKFQKTLAQSSATDRGKTIGQFGVMSSLGAVPQLRERLDAANLDQILVKHMKKVATQKSTGAGERTAEATACVDCLLQLYPGQSGQVRSLRALFDVTKSDELRNDQSKNTTSHLLATAMRGIKSSIDSGALRRLDSSKLKEVTDDTLSLMQEFSDSRKGQVLGTEILHSIAGNADNGINALGDANADQFIVQNARKFKIWSDLQVASFRALDKLTAEPENSRDVPGRLRMANIMDAIRGAQVAHSKCDELRAPLQRVAQRMMPEGYLDQAVSQATRDIRLGMQGRDWSTIQDDLNTLAGLLEWPEGQRIAAKTAVIPLLTDLLALSISDSDAPPEIAGDVSKLLLNLTNGSSCCKAALKCGTSNAIESIVAKLLAQSGSKNPPNGEVVSNLMKTLTNLAVRDPREAKVLQRLAPRFAELGKMLPAGDPVSISRFRDCYTDMLMALPDQMRVKDAACEAMVAELISDLESDNFEKSARAATKLAIYAKQDATAAHLMGNGVVKRTYRAMDINAGTVAVNAHVLLLERLSAVPEFNVSDEEAKGRVKMLSQLIQQSRDSAFVGPAMNVLGRVVQNHKNSKIFENMDGLYDTIRHAQKLCGSDKEGLGDSVGVIMNVVGGEAAVVSWLNSLGTLGANTESPENDLDLLSMLEESDIYLSTTLNKPDAVCEAFGANTKKLGAWLTKDTSQPAKQIDTAKLKGISKFVDQSCQAASRTHDTNAKQAIAVHLMDHIIEPLTAGVVAVMNEREDLQADVVVPALEAFVQLLRNPDTRNAALESCNEGGLADAVMKIMQDPNQSSDLKTTYASFLNALTKDAAGSAIVKDAFQRQHKSQNRLDWQFKRMASLDTSIDLPLLNLDLSAMIPMLRDDAEARIEFWSKPENITQLDQLADDTDPVRLARKIGILAAGLADNASPENLQHLERAVNTLRDKFESGRMNKSEIGDTIKALLESLQAAGNSPDTQQALRRNKVFSLLGDLTADAVRTPGLYKTIFPILTELAALGESNAQSITNDILTTAIKDKALFQNDNDLKAKLVGFLQAAGAYKGLGYTIGQLDGFPDLLDALNGDEINGGIPPTELLADIKEVEDLIRTDEPNVMTLRKVLALWKADMDEVALIALAERKRSSTPSHCEEGVTVKIPDTLDSVTYNLSTVQSTATSVAIADHITFVFNEMSTRARGVDGGNLSADARAEILAGLECLRILHMYAVNLEELEQREEDEIIASGIMNFGSDQLVQQHFVNTGLDLVLFFPNLAPAFSSVPGFGPTMLQCIKDARQRKIGTTSFEAEGSGMTTPETGTFHDVSNPSICLENRLVFLSKIIPHRKWLEDTNAVMEFMDCWDDVDTGTYDQGVLYATMRCLRSTVSQGNLEFLLQQRLPERLRALVGDKTVAYRGLSDAFFLAGVLGSFPMFKEATGNVGMIDTTLAFIKSHKDDAAQSEASGAVTNALLALGSICVDHHKNVDRFVAANGIDLSVSMINPRKKGEENSADIAYDRVNAAAALLCNVNYKRDDVKELYARAHAPKAIMAAIAGYDGTPREDATRCMHSMFKAVGNMALYTPNVRNFVDSGIVQVYQSFLGKASEMHPSVHEAGVKCLANLLMENDPQITTAFSALVPTIISDVSNRLGHSEVEIFRHGLEALQYLSRDETNAQKAVDCDIIPQCVMAVENASSPVVLNAVISFLASLSRHEHMAQALTNQGVLTAVISVLEKEKSIAGNSTELSQKSFIVMRRLFKDVSIAKIFVDQGSAAGLAKMIVNRAESASAQIEGSKLLLFLLQQFPPPTESKANENDDEWDEEEPGNEGFMPVSHLIKRPPSPRSYQQLGLSPQLITDLIMTLTQTMSGQNGSTLHKFLEVALLLLGYFAHEKIIGCEDAYFRANFFPAATRVLNDNPGNVLYADIIAGIAANIACVADDSAFAVFKSHVEFADSLKNSARFIDKEYKVEKRYILNVASTAADPNTNQLDFLPYAAFDFDFDRVVTTEDIKGNGVQDLSVELKSILRKGGEFFIITSDNLKGEKTTWKASLDLLRLQWGPGKDCKVFPNDVPILRCTSIRRGAVTNVLCEARKAHKMSCSEACLCAVFGLLGDGEALNLRFKSHSQREIFCQLAKDWRDAAANIA